MKSILAVVAVVLTLSFSSLAQSLTNEAITNRIRSERAEKAMTLTSDPVSKTSKIMAVSDNFVNSESSRAGLQAMNFAIGLFYPGQELKSTPETFLLTFWVL